MASPKIRRFPTSNMTAWKGRLKDNPPYDIIGIAYCFIGCWGWAALQFYGGYGRTSQEGGGWDPQGHGSPLW